MQIGRSIYLVFQIIPINKYVNYFSMNDFENLTSSPRFKNLLPVEFVDPGGWKRGVTIYAKALAIFAFAVLLLFGVLFALTESVILTQFQTIEHQQLEGELSRTKLLLQRNLENLAEPTGDWGHWKEMHAFAEGKRPHFLQEELHPGVIETLRLDFLTVWDAQGKNLALTTPAGNPLEIPPLSTLLLKKLQEFANTPSKTTTDSIQTGFLIFNDQILMVARSAIETYSPTSSVAGTIILGRVLNRNRLNDLQPNANAELLVQPLTEALKNLSTREDTRALLNNRNLKGIIHPINDETIRGATLLHDINAEPIAVLILHQKRNLYDAGLRAVRIFLLAMTAAGGGLVIVLWFVIDWNLLRRIGRIDRGVRLLQSTGNLPKELQLQSHDELGRLARSISALSQSLREAEANYRRMFETSTDGTLVLSYPSLIILEANLAFTKLVGKPPEELLMHPLAEIIPEFPCKELINPHEASHPFHRAEFPLHSNHETPYFTEVIGVQFPASNGTRLQLAFRNVTERLQSESKLRELSGRLLNLQDDERRRIARELHDSTAQNLSALEMNFTLLQKIAPAEPSRLREILDQSRVIADATSREIRTIAYLLHPPLLDEVGLSFALSWFVEGYITRTNITVTLDLPADTPRFPAEIETTLFRIIQESLTNIYRHSGSKTAEIRLKIEDYWIFLEVQDFGHGFPATSKNQKKSYGVGLPGMQERVRQYHGDFLLESSKAGTLIQVKLPISHHETNA